MMTTLWQKIKEFWSKRKKEIQIIPTNNILPAHQKKNRAKKNEQAETGSLHFPQKKIIYFDQFVFCSIPR